VGGGVGGESTVGWLWWCVLGGCFCLAAGFKAKIVHCEVHTYNPALLAPAPPRTNQTEPNQTAPGPVSYPLPGSPPTLCCACRCPCGPGATPTTGCCRGWRCSASATTDTSVVGLWRGAACRCLQVFRLLGFCCVAVFFVRICKQGTVSNTCHVIPDRRTTVSCLNINLPWRFPEYTQQPVCRSRWHEPSPRSDSETAPLPPSPTTPHHSPATPRHFNHSPPCHLAPMHAAANAIRSAVSWITLAVGLPAPWPARTCRGVGHMLGIGWQGYW